MANIVVERSAIGDFLDELPGLLMQYQQMKWQMEDRALDRESRKVERAQGIALQQFYNKQEEVKRTEAMYDKYQGISPSEMTDGGISLLNMVDEKNNIDTKAITDNLDRLSSYQSDLMTGLNELRDQSSVLREMQSTYAGAEGVLQEHEYREFQEGALKSVEEGGLGWTTTAGADLAFYETDPIAREDLAFRMSERYSKDAKIGAAGSYGLVQSVILPKEGETSVDPDDLEYIDQITGKRVTPTEEMANEMHSMGLQGDFDDFMTNLYALEMLRPEKGAEIRAFLQSNPNTAKSFYNLERDYTTIKTLETDLAGINLPEPVNAYNNFVDSISGVTNKGVLFGLYQDAVSILPEAEHAQYFEALEGQLGVEDAYPEYQSWLNPNQPPLPLEETTNKAVETLEAQSEQLYTAGLSHLPIYDEINDSLRALYTEIRDRENYEDYLTEIERKKLMEAGPTSKELSELTTLLGLEQGSLEEALERKRQLDIESSQRSSAFYERGLKE